MTYLARDAALKTRWRRFLASPIERRWAHRARPLKFRSRSSASESWEAIATRELDDDVSILSSKVILVLRVDAAHSLSADLNHQQENQQLTRIGQPVGFKAVNSEEQWIDATEYEQSEAFTKILRRHRAHWWLNVTIFSSNFMMQLWDYRVNVNMSWGWKGNVQSTKKEKTNLDIGCSSGSLEDFSSSCLSSASSLA